VSGQYQIDENELLHLVAHYKEWTEQCDSNPDFEQKSLLHQAVEIGDTHKVDRLLKAGACVNTTDVWQLTPLHDAARNGHTELVVKLIEAGAHVNAADDNGSTPLYEATMQGHSTIIGYLIQAEAQVNMFAYGVTPLHIAATKGYESIVTQLLEASVNVNVVDCLGSTPLYNAVTNRHEKIVKHLIAAHSDLNIRNIYNGSLLECAQWVGHPSILHILLKAGSKVGVKDEIGRTVLHRAAMDNIEHKLDIIKLLIRWGFSWYEKDDFGKTPEQLLIECSTQVSPELINHFVVDLFLKIKVCYDLPLNTPTAALEYFLKVHPAWASLQRLGFKRWAHWFNQDDNFVSIPTEIQWRVIKHFIFMFDDKALPVCHMPILEQLMDRWWERSEKSLMRAR
jgi:ankyrin repeat protein